MRKIIIIIYRADNLVDLHFADGTVLATSVDAETAQQLMEEQENSLVNSIND
jgi:hypothetical protein